MRWIKSPNKIDINMDDHSDLAIPYARYQPGETVYIKEAHRFVQGNGKPNDFGVVYTDDEIRWWRDNGGQFNYPIVEKRRSPLFMPAWAARYFIKIKDARPERTRDITPEDCLLEGITFLNELFPAINTEYKYKTRYFALYDSINGKGSHEKNWDWRYEFELAIKDTGKG